MALAPVDSPPPPPPRPQRPRPSGAGRAQGEPTAVATAAPAVEVTGDAAPEDRYPLQASYLSVVTSEVPAQASAPPIERRVNDRLPDAVATLPPAPSPATARDRRAVTRRVRTPPVARLGVCWAVAMVAALSVSPVLAAVVLAPVAAVAVLSAWRSVPEADHDLVWLACACGGAATLAAAGGPVPAVVAVVAAGVALPALTARAAPRPARIRVALCAVAPAAGAASVVLADRQGVTECLILVGAVMLYDAANHVMGVGPTGGHLGALAGILTVAVLSIVVAGVLVVPFSGSSPWVCCGLVALGATVSIRASHQLVGGALLPAWRRLDALFLAGPAWVIAVALLLHR